MSSRRGEFTNNGICTHQPYSQTPTMIYAPPSTRLTETLNSRTRNDSTTNFNALQRARGRHERGPVDIHSLNRSPEPQRPPQARLSTSPYTPSDAQTYYRRDQNTIPSSQPRDQSEYRGASTAGLTPAQEYRLATSGSSTRVEGTATVARPSLATLSRQSLHRPDDAFTATAPANEFRRKQAAPSPDTQTPHSRGRSGKTNQRKDKRRLRDQYGNRRRNSNESIELPNDPGNDLGNQEGQPPGEGGEECCDECACDECCAEFGKCIMECFKGDCAFDCKD